MTTSAPAHPAAHNLHHPHRRGSVVRVVGWLHTHRLWLLPLGIVAAAVVLDPRRGGPTLCPFALCTGVACPGCGLTRATGWLIRGDLGAALTAHPLVLLVAGWGIAAWGVGFLRARGHTARVSRRLVDRALVATAVAFLATWLVRLGVGALPPV